VKQCKILKPKSYLDKIIFDITLSVEFIFDKFSIKGITSSDKKVTDNFRFSNFPTITNSSLFNSEMEHFKLKAETSSVIRLKFSQTNTLLDIPLYAQKICLALAFTQMRKERGITYKTERRNGKKERVEHEDRKKKMERKN
jgi:hypothetical protein